MELHQNNFSYTLSAGRFKSSWYWCRQFAMGPSARALEQVVPTLGLPIAWARDKASKMSRTISPLPPDSLFSRGPTRSLILKDFRRMSVRGD